MIQISKVSRWLFSILIFCCASAAQERYVRSVDEGKTDASFNAFREKLISAVKKRDAKYLISQLDRNIKVSFGGDDGIEDFKRFWKINSPNSKVWDELLPVLTNGGKFFTEGRTKMFSAPYSFSNFPEDLDAFEHSVIFGNNVNLRETPNLQSKVITMLSYNVVKVDFQNSVTDGKAEPTYLWLKVETLGGKKGFVNAQFVRSPIDYRAIFEKKGRVWKMTAFVAGD